MYVFITIDVEDPYYQDMYRIWGHRGSQQFGVPMIRKILESYGLKGVFFVDVYERALHSDAAIARVLEDIYNSGHEVQLHTHPGVDLDRFGPGGMAGRSYEEQCAILEDGCTFIKSVIGEWPKAHRAGSYKADNTTLRALAAVGIKFDASLFYKNKNCKIDTQGMVYNDIFVTHGVVEVPVTTITVSSPIFRNVQMKLDIEHDVSILVEGLEAMYAAGAHAAVLFLHSWSFLPLYSTKRYVRQHNIDKFCALCRYLSEHPEKFQVVGFNSAIALPEQCAVKYFPAIRMGFAQGLRTGLQKAVNRIEFQMYKGFILRTKEKYGF